MIKGEKFSPGNTVRLISGGPLMTINSWDAQRIEYLCTWFKGDELYSNHFREELLQHSTKETGMGMSAWVS